MAEPAAASKAFDLAMSTSLDLNDLTQEQREMFFSQLRSRFCLVCGSADPGCQCWNDD